ncbi:hypothetical protein KSS87_018750 [Heliosperma pusillum]|nr:hypothetical protein KSS87_018750 [Heliosperma pusillum]
MGLDPSYSTARSQLLGTEPQPSLHGAYSRLIQEEEVRHVTQRQTEDNPAMAFAVRGSHPPSSRPWCTHCKKHGHLEPRCWEKHGYPEGRGPRRGKQGSDSTAPHSTAPHSSAPPISSTGNHVHAVFGGSTLGLRSSTPAEVRVIFYPFLSLPFDLLRVSICANINFQVLGITSSKNEAKSVSVVHNCKCGLLVVIKKSWRSDNPATLEGGLRDAKKDVIRELIAEKRAFEDAFVQNCYVSSFLMEQKKKADAEKESWASKNNQLLEECKWEKRDR